MTGPEIEQAALAHSDVKERVFAIVQAHIGKVLPTQRAIAATLETTLLDAMSTPTRHSTTR